MTLPMATIEFQDQLRDQASRRLRHSGVPPPVAKVERESGTVILSRARRRRASALRLLAAILASFPTLAFAQQTPGVKWKTPASWNIDVLAGRTFSALTIVAGDPARDVRRERGWVAGATFGRYDGHRAGFTMQLLFGRQRTTELLFDPPRPAAYALHFVEVPLLLRFDPLARKTSGGLVSVFGGVGIGRRFHLERAFDARTSTARWAMYTDAIAGASVDLRRVIVNVEYLNGLTKFAPASGPPGAKHFRSWLVTAGYEVKRGPLPRAAESVWEVELHAGGLMASRATAGDGRLPSAGSAFPTVVPGVASRRVSTWLVGDGPVLFTQATGSLPARPPAIAALDRVLTQPSAQRKDGALFGVRLSRPITSRLSAELSLDVSQTPVTIEATTLGDIETSRASFVSAFNGLFSALPGSFTLTGVTATADVQNGRGRQVLASAGAVVRLTRDRKLTPYARADAGLITGNSGTRAIVRGTYDFRAVVNAPFHESDLVTIKFSSGSGWLGLAGGGATLGFSDRTGLRIDAGVAVSRNELRTTLSTGPFRTTTAAPFASMASGDTTPAIQFSNANSASVPSSLTGTPLQDFETFRGRGLQVQTAVSVGIYRRF